MINAIKLPALRNGDFSTFISNTLNIVRRNDPALLGIQPQYDALYAIYLKYEELFKVPTGSILSTKVEELDMIRDNILNGMLALTNGFSYSSNTEEKDSANLLAESFANYGTGIARDTYTSQTASIKNLIEDWEAKPKYLAAINALNLGKWKTELGAANFNFDELYVTRATDMGTASPDTVRTTRLEAYEAYYQLRDHINAYFTIKNGAEPFGATVSALNGLLDGYNNMIERRGVNEEPVDPITPATPLPPASAA